MLLVGVEVVEMGHVVIDRYRLAMTVDGPLDCVPTLWLVQCGANELVEHCWTVWKAEPQSND